MPRGIHLCRCGCGGGLSPLVAPDNSRIATIGVQLNVPLYTGGAISSKERLLR